MPALQRVSRLLERGGPPWQRGFVEAPNLQLQESVMSYLNQALPILRWTAATVAAIAHFIHAANAVAANELPPDLVRTLELSNSWGDFASLFVNGAWIGLAQLFTAIPSELTTTFLVIWWPFETWNLYIKAKKAFITWRANRKGLHRPRPDVRDAPNDLRPRLVAKPVRQSRRARRRHKGKRRR